MKPGIHTPLVVVFASLLEGCFFGCGEITPEQTSFDLTESNIRAIKQGNRSLLDFEVSAVADPPVDTDANVDDTSDTGDTDSVDTSCGAVCSLAGGECISGPEDRGQGVLRYTCDTTPICVGGRMHGCIQTSERAGGADALGCWLAQAAHDEGASVVAFEALATELEAHGAPQELVHRVHRAQADEVRHAASMERLALAHGGRIPAIQVVAIEPRSLEAIATENAVEACVLETWAALRASYQAEHASTPQLRAVFAQIAIEETQHAELARDLQGWLESRLDVRAVARVHQARDSMVGRLCHLDQRVDPVLASTLGLPTAAVAEHLTNALAQRLWTVHAAA